MMIQGVFEPYKTKNMVTFGKKLREAREAQSLSQQELAKKIGSVHTVIGRYERDEMKPSIDVVRALAEALNTTVGYLLGESEDMNLLKDPTMLKRFNEISALSEEDKKCIYTFLDAFLAKNKLNSLLK
ncbi:MAG: helix-turn-helix domain-containing protein [Cytophagaceae bacterium]